MKTIVGIRPTSGRLHIGHYFSVIKPAIEEKARILIAEYHAPECTGDDIAKMVTMMNRALGGAKDIFYTFQSAMFNAPLYFKLLSVAKMGELERMTQYKSAKVKTPHLLVYPVLMAHDLVGYDKVIVGEDQKQHVEYANVLFKRLGLKPIKGDFRGGRVMSLIDPTKKMSKSEPEGCLFLDDDFEEKLKKAVTTPAGIKNLTYIAKQFHVTWNPKLNKESKELLAKMLNAKFKNG
jgi:tryptophanyl-tRNA synthetase